VVGDIDEMQLPDNINMSLGQQIQEDLALLGLEGLPTWMQGDPAAMLLAVQSSNEGWSAGRFATELSQTAGFKSRFTGFDDFMALHGDSTVLGNIDAYLNEEARLRQALFNARGPNTNVDYSYLGALLGQGWTADEAQNVLRAEQQFNDNPEALADLNAILAARGLGEATAGDFLNVLLGNEDAVPGEIFDALNDALFLDALAQQDIDIDNLLSESFGTDVAEFVAGPGAFDEMAQNIARALGDNSVDIALRRYGLTAKDLITGLAENQGEMLVKLSKLSRERQAAGEGFSSSTANIDERGRLRLAGLGNV
jgi:hypothetical protein